MRTMYVHVWGGTKRQSCSLRSAVFEKVSMLLPLACPPLSCACLLPAGAWDGRAGTPQPAFQVLENSVQACVCHSRHCFRLENYATWNNF